MTRIDHAKVARMAAMLADDMLLDEAGANANPGAVAALAQAHATLALVEQQQVANRIALAQLEFAAFPLVSPAGNVPESIWGVNTGNGQRVLRKDIADAIGVTR
jgi:hypothetical protein